MDLVVGILVASLVAEEALRFGPVFEQRSDSSCGLAAAASLLSLFCGIPATEPGLAARLVSLGPRSGAGATLGDILVLLADAGIKAKAFRMDPPSLSSALAAGYIPLILRYDKPEPHFALLIGSDGQVFALADPARGLEALEESDLLRRWDGTALLVDRRSATEAGRKLARRWSRFAIGRLALLRGGRAGDGAVRALDAAATSASAR